MFDESVPHLGPLWWSAAKPIGFSWRFYRIADPDWVVVRVPLWMPALALAAPGVYLLLRTRNRLGHCRQCRYNLTGLPPNSPCPECGRPSAAKARES